MSNPRADWAEVALVAVLLLLFMIQAGGSAIQKSLTMDEYTHFGAAVSYVENNYYRLNPNHPPFCKVITGLAIRPLHPEVPEAPVDKHRKAQRYYGIRFVRQNAGDIERITFVGRLPHIGIAVLLGLGLWLAVRYLFGRFSAMSVLVFWATDPNLLAHARLVHTDSGAAVFVYLCLAWLILGVLRKPTWARCFLFSLLLGLALLTKFSTVVLAVIVPLQIILYAFGTSRGWLAPPASEGTTGSPVAFWRIFLRLALTATVTTLVLALLLYRGQPGWWFYGLSRVLAHNETGHIAYLLGKWFQDGQWYYFVVALAVKTPVPLLALALLGAVVILRGLRRGRTFEQFVLVLPGLIWLVFAMSSRINLGLRHVLPAYVFMFILAGSGIKELSRRRWSVVLVAVLLCWQGVSAVRTYPDYIPYFNEPAGGPKAGIRYFADSNCDWGQELLTLREWMREKGKSRVVVHSLASPAPDIYGLQAIGRLTPPPAPDNPAFLALGVRDYAKIMFMEDGRYEASREFLSRQERVEHLGSALYVFRVTEPFPRPFH